MALSKNSAALVAMAAVLALAAGGVAGFGAPRPRSYLTTWSGPGCTSETGVSINLNACGCSDVQLFGGYEFNHRGEPVTLFGQPGCTGEPGATLVAQGSMCSAFGWRSAFIHCGGA